MCESYTRQKNKIKLLTYLRENSTLHHTQIKILADNVSRKLSLEQCEKKYLLWCEQNMRVIFT